MKSFLAIKAGEAKGSFLTEENMSALRSHGPVTDPVADGAELTPELVRSAVGDSEVYFTCWGSPRLDAGILERAPKLRLLTHLCGTVVPFVSDEMWDRGIRVISGNDFFAESVAEGTIGYILSAQRDIPGYSRRLKENGIWKHPGPYNQGLIGKKIGIVSYGAVARHLVRMLQPFRPEIYLYDIRPLPEEDVKKYKITQVPLETLFAECEIITLHTPLNEHTRHLVGKPLLDLIKPGALFVNTSRGAVVDQAALEESLADGRYRAFLDVFEKEPPLPGCPLYRLPNVTMMPHMAGPTYDMRKYIASRLIAESAGFIDGDGPLPHEITREAAAQMSRK
ncbi:MAG: hydroxyacid dehydrogenase [Clostridia bacterium]|nr:hydroxyacid dehydrogenase [Clostridia bacterium]